MVRLHHTIPIELEIRCLLATGFAHNVKNNVLLLVILVMRMLCLVTVNVLLRLCFLAFYDGFTNVPCIPEVLAEVNKVETTR